MIAITSIDPAFPLPHPMDFTQQAVDTLDKSRYILWEPPEALQSRCEPLARADHLLDKVST